MLDTPASAARRLQWDAEQVALYQRRTGLAPERLAAMLDASTRLNAEDAVRLGFADEIVDDDESAISSRRAAEGV